MVQWLSLPASAGDMGSIPGPRRFHLPQGNKAHELQLLSPHATTTKAREPYSLWSTTKEATTMRSLCTTIRERPRAAKKTQHNEKLVTF